MTIYEKLTELYGSSILDDNEKNQIDAFVSNYCDDDPIGIYELISSNKILQSAFSKLKQHNSGEGYLELRRLIKSYKK